MYRKTCKALITIKAHQDIGSIRIWCGYLWGFFFVFFTGVRYADFARGFPIHPAEPYMLAANSWTGISFLLLGYLLVVSDIPFMDSLIYPTISRSGKRAWTGAMLGWIMVRTLLYTAVTVAGGIVVCIWRGAEPGKDWSEIMRFLIQARPDAAVRDYGITMFSRNLLSTYGPWEALLHGVLLFACYGYFLALLLFGANLRIRVGSWLAVLVHFWGILVLKSGFTVFIGLSPVGHAIVDSHAGTGGIPLLWSYGLFGAALVLLTAVIFRVSGKCDYDVASGGRVW